MEKADHEAKPGHLAQFGALYLVQTEQTRRALHEAAVRKHDLDFKAPPLNWIAPKLKGN